MDYDEKEKKKKMEMHRSISMPTKPKNLEPTILKRSEEKESVYSGDYYPTSPPPPRKARRKCSSLETNMEQKMLSRSDGWGVNSAESPPEVTQHDEYDFLFLNPIEKRPRRIIEKTGRENINHKHIPSKSLRYMRDLVTTLIELDWKYMLTMFLGSYFISWFFFAVLSYMVAYYHGDLIFDELTGERLGEGKDPCIIGVYDFLSILIYSIETQTTIGFGEKYPSEECPETMFLFILQIICSIALEGAMISIIYAKTARPARQMTKLKFSDKAVICHRDGKLCLQFRVSDPREQHSIESKIRVFYVVDRRTCEDEVIKTHTELKLNCNGQQLIAWPEIVCHVIDETSPLYRLKSAKDLNAAEFELYVSIVGTSPATAQVTEARTSYISREVFWGQRFTNIISYDAHNERYMIDYAHFNTTISVDMTEAHVEATTSKREHVET